MEKVFIQIHTEDGVYITTQDVSIFTQDQVDEMVKVKEEYGLICTVKREVF